MKISKFQIINNLALNKTVEEIISNITKGANFETLRDLAQMIYLELLEKDDKKIIDLYKNKQLNFFITRMLLNNIKSKTSKYYYLFNKHYDRWNEINPIDNEKED